jgi:elongation factor G
MTVRGQVYLSDLLEIIHTTQVRVTRPANNEEAVSALVFKLMHDKSVGTIVFLRVYSGTLRTGMAVLNTRQQRRERVGRLMFMHANKREEVDEVHAGDICAALNLRGVRTGDTLCSLEAPVVLESLRFPEPVIQLAVEARSRGEQQKMEEGLTRLAAEDPSLRVEVDPETGQQLLSGMGELHLEIVVDRLRTEYGVEARVGQPKVAYRETLRQKVRQEYRHVRQTGGPGQYAHVVMEVEPGPRSSGLVFVDDTHSGVIPKEFIPAIEKGVAGEMQRGVLAGYPVVDVEVHLVDGSTHVRDSTPQAFTIAGSLAFQEAARRAGVRLLEPVMDVEVTTPEEFLGDVLGDLSARRGRVRGMEGHGTVRSVSAQVPMASLFGYVTSLRGRTQGRAMATLRLATYEPVPDTLQESVTVAEACVTPWRPPSNAQLLCAGWSNQRSSTSTRLRAVPSCARNARERRSAHSKASRMSGSDRLWQALGPRWRTGKRCGRIASRSSIDGVLSRGKQPKQGARRGPLEWRSSRIRSHPSALEAGLQGQSRSGAHLFPNVGGLGREKSRHS